MRSVLKLLRQREFAAAGYIFAWKIVGSLPYHLLEKLFRYGADAVSDHGRGMEMLRRNLSRVVSPENVTAELVRDSVRSYARYWLEAFRLPTISRHGAALDRITEGVVGEEYVRQSYEQKKGVILVLPHSGNWDMAGYWLVNNFGTFTTVAERVRPPELFDSFVNFRESLGFDVIALTGGEEPPMKYLRRVLESGGIVCLLGERDLKQTGIEVSFFGEKTTMPTGAAQLAMDTGAALHVAHSWFEGEGWGLSASQPLEVTTVPQTMQQIADLFAENIAAHPEDWHMLQPQWSADKKK